MFNGVTFCCWILFLFSRVKAYDANIAIIASSVKVRVLCHGGGAGGGTRMRNYDVISGWQVRHLLIVHLNSFDLLCEMNGYAIYSPHSFHTKDQRNWDGLSIDVAPVNQKWHHSCACACVYPPPRPLCPPHGDRTLTFTLLYICISLFDLDLDIFFHTIM